MSQKSMKKYSKKLEPIANEIYLALRNNNKINVKDYGWENHVWQSQHFSWAHLEMFCTEKVSVLHCVVMPHKNSSAPIYGFDVIELSGHLTGMFLDLTPVDNKIYDVPNVGELRKIPEWADFFSPNFLCCKPNESDLLAGSNLLKEYLNMLPSLTEKDYSEAQQKYINGQRKNPQTRKMLASHIGSEKADEFIEEVLFPNIK